ncbi:MAG: hypothetical protein ACPG5T_10605, partial [Endozoicomonas sp.]
KIRDPLFGQPINTRHITPSSKIAPPAEPETPKKAESEELKEKDLTAIRPLLKKIQSGTIQEAEVEARSLELFTDFGNMCLLHFLEKYQPDTYSKLIEQIQEIKQISPYQVPDESLLQQLEEWAGLSETSQDTPKKRAEGSKGQPVINDDHEEIYSTVQGTQLSRLHDYLQSISGTNWQTMKDELQFKLNRLNQENLKAFMNNDATQNNNTVAFNDIPDDLLSFARRLAPQDSTDTSVRIDQSSAPGTKAPDDTPIMAPPQRAPEKVTANSIVSALKSNQYNTTDEIMGDIEKLKGKVHLQKLVIELKELQSQSWHPMQPKIDLKALIQKAESQRTGRNPPTRSG